MQQFPTNRNNLYISFIVGQTVHLSSDFWTDWSCYLFKQTADNFSVVRNGLCIQIQYLTELNNCLIQIWMESSYMSCNCHNFYSINSVCVGLSHSMLWDLLCNCVACVIYSDVKRGQNLEAEAEYNALRPRPRPELWGKGQDYEVKAEAKNNYEKVPNND